MLVIAVADEPAADEVASRLERVFGFGAASVCLRCDRDPERITDVGMQAFETRRPQTFAVRVRRRDKSFPLTSQDLERAIGADIQRRTGLPVNLRAPELELRVELDVESAYVHVRELATAGGLPVGMSGRAVSLLSGGIDSPVASLLAMKRGLSVEFLHFSGEPYLEPTATTKAQAQAKVLNGFQAERPGRYGWCRSGSSRGCSPRSPTSRTGSCSTAARWPASHARSRSACAPPRSSLAIRWARSPLRPFRT